MVVIPCSFLGVTCQRAPPNSTTAEWTQHLPSHAWPHQRAAPASCPRRWRCQQMSLLPCPRPWPPPPPLQPMQQRLGRNSWSSDSGAAAPPPCWPSCLTQPRRPHVYRGREPQPCAVGRPQHHHRQCRRGRRGRSSRGDSHRHNQTGPQAQPLRAAPKHVGISQQQPPTHAVQWLDRHHSSRRRDHSSHGHSTPAQQLPHAQRPQGQPGLDGRSGDCPRRRCRCATCHDDDRRAAAAAAADGDQAPCPAVKGAPCRRRLCDQQDDWCRRRGSCPPRQACHFRPQGTHIYMKKVEEKKNTDRR